MNLIKNVNDLKVDLLHNRNEGTIAWFLHRLTGLALVSYIFLHLIVLGSNSLFGPGSFDRLMGSFENPLFKILEIGLILVIGFHMLNGLRVIIADFFDMTRQHRLMFWLVILLTVMVLVITLLVFLPKIK